MTRARRLVTSVYLACIVAACGGRAAPPPAPSFAGPPGAPQVVPGALEARPLLGDVPLRAQRLGAGPLAIVATGTMIEGERLGAFVEVPRDACLLAYGRASPSLEDIDLAAFADEGNPLAVDEGPDPKPTLLLCPPHPDRVYVAAHAASGEGLCVIAAQIVPRDRAELVARAVGARGAIGGGPRTPEAWPGLDDQVRAHRAAIGGTWEESRRVALSTDSRAVAAVAFTVEEGGCTDAVLVPDEDVAILDADVVDAEGRLVARAKEGTQTRFVTVCSPVALQGSLQVRPHVGRGLVAVVLARSKGDGAREMRTRPDVAWFAPAQPLDVTRAARNAALAKAGYGAPTATSNGQLALGRRTTVPIDLTPGGCTRIDVVAGAPLALVEASVWDDSGALLGTAEGADGATVFACGKGKGRVDLATRGRPGPYTVLVRPERWKDAVLLAHPLAAGRMLGRSATGPTAAHEGTAASVKHAALESARQYVQNTSIPPGKCTRIAAGVEGEGTGLELRLVDATSGEELDRSAGQTAASVRGCALATATRSVRLEARATAGRLDAVIGERVVP
jgi:hypothetical protein